MLQLLWRSRVSENWNRTWSGVEVPSWDSPHLKLLSWQLGGDVTSFASIGFTRSPFLLGNGEKFESLLVFQFCQWHRDDQRLLPLRGDYVNLRDGHNQVLTVDTAIKHLYEGKGGGGGGVDELPVHQQVTSAIRLGHTKKKNLPVKFQSKNNTSNIVHFTSCLQAKDNYTARKKQLNGQTV